MPSTTQVNFISWQIVLTDLFCLNVLKFIIDKAETKQ